jgi:subtilisin family serine protease
MSILCLAASTSQANDPTTAAYTPDGKVEFILSTEKILIAFEDGLSITDQQNILSAEKGIQQLKLEDLLPSPNVTIARIQLQSGETVGNLLERLNLNEQIRYANPFLIYKDGTNQGIQDRVIVRLKSRKDYNQISVAVKRFNLTVAEKNEFDPLMYVLQTSKQTPGNALDVANALHETGAFNYAEVDFLLLLKRFNTNDPSLDYQWSLDNTGSSLQYNGTAGIDMEVFDAWGSTTGSSSIKVAVVDEGVDLIHPDLAGNMLGGYDATNQGSGGAPQGDDAHGTACAGIIAASGNNNLGGTGVAYNCKIIPVRIAYSSGSSWITSNTWIGNALNWSWQTAGADILSNSWGGGSSSSTINNAIDGAVNNGRGGLGSPVLFAAGNDNGANSYPATQNNVISVIAMSMCAERKSPSSCDGETWWGSNYGTGADVAAPGVKIYCTDISGSAGYSNGDYTGTFNGTSSATPNTAGVMALILSASSGLTEVQARVALESTCQKVGGYNYNNGVSGQPNGSWSNDLGHGLVSAYQAVLSVSPQFSLDAGISAVVAPEGSICATSATPEVTLRNYGSTTINSVQIWSNVDGSNSQVYNWTGSLASGSSTNVTLSNVSFAGGSHTFNAWTMAPNAQQDEQSGNDESSSSFASASNSITLSITFDNYPEETSWAVMDGATTIASGGTYASQSDGSTLNIGLCLPDGCFDFVINDAYGDGICCSYGNGSYILTDESNGGTLASGGSFTTSESTNFCVSSSNPLVASISSSGDATCNGGSDGSATVSASGGATPYSYSWSNGASGATASGLAAGTYTVTVTDNNSNQATANVTISQPTLLVASTSGTDTDCNGGATGSATASASGGATPYSYAWSNGTATATANSLGAGSYSVTVTDNNGCTDVSFVTINNMPDSDNDGVCDAEDQCPGSDDALIGTSCDDGNACTTGDVYDANCGCSGTLIDSDNDGVCDADDQCPGSDDALIGTSCDDGNACTTGDVYDANCGCSGTYQDSDNDGVCDAEDQCPGSDDALIGTSCDDGNACTTGDVYDANCGCSGTLIEGCGGCTYVSIDSNDFEGGWGIWNDGGSDVARISNATYANSGTYLIQLRDNSGVGSSTTTDNLNLLAFSEVTIDFSYYARSMDNASEDFWLQISTNGGSSFSTIEEWNRDDEFVNDQRYNETVVYAGLLSSATKFRFRCDASGNSDWIYIDDVVITGCQGAIPDPTCTDGIQNGDEAGVDCGGSFCAPCITCSDGIQNGDETGVDCGGSFCPPCNSGGCTYETINNGTFESGWGIWNDGGSDARRSSNDASFANNGTYCFRIQDNTSTSVVTTDAMNLLNYDELTIDFSYITSSMESGEDFWLQISTNGGANYTTAESWVRGTHFNNGVRNSGSVMITGPFTTDTRLRFRNDASTNNDRVYIDDVLVYGCLKSGAPRLAIIADEDNQEEPIIESGLSNLNLYPNPTGGVLNITFNLDKGQNVRMVVSDLAGKVALDKSLTQFSGLNKMTVDTRELPLGMYVMIISNAEEVISKRFVVQR